LIVKYWRVLEGDLSLYHQVSEEDLGTMSARRFGVLINAIPGDSRWGQVVKDNPQELQPERVSSVLDRL